jgi:uncharacterized membrane protein YeaQ/YmgE (transglycosylase-associated protein family)
MCFHLVGWAVFGLCIGAIARVIWPGREAMGCLMTIFVGIIGSVIGGIITYLLTGGPEQTYAPASWIMSIVGALVFLWIYGAGANRRGML